MSQTMLNIIENSKNRISKTFFRIVRVDDSSYVIKEYSGPVKSINTMMYNGWNRHSYLKQYINEDYPIFNINDFKSTDGFTIEKKSDDDLLRLELMEFIEYYNLNQNLFLKVKELKKFALRFCDVSFASFETFSNYQETIIAKLNQLNVPAIDKVKYQSMLVSLVNDVYLELDKLNIEKSRLFFDNKFKYFFSLIKD
jgi:hypothetical protein